MEKYIWILLKSSPVSRNILLTMLKFHTCWQKTILSKSLCIIWKIKQNTVGDTKASAYYVYYTASAHKFLYFSMAASAASLEAKWIL